MQGHGADGEGAGRLGEGRRGALGGRIGGGKRGRPGEAATEAAAEGAEAAQADVAKVRSPATAARPLRRIG
ncbi:hypothetical protein [Nonomuraea dietziae]|uniref:hypothetical protein n=1 Tax=Nonomuraea dietziae TaxID=65515 RepID=UPI0033EA86C0